ncbi:hypothetical protein [Nitriliruptor alkaliphilus]|uniref:hypothetical protein n=1 Tax=Nitriliruptor alkaliphilus TaxID=427918 RepID=UPI000696611E|nr:hypothetical protein [Nitriliruptor alkaliphilus]
MRRRLLTAATLTTVTLLTLGTAAHAGEITGTGEDTPIRDYTANSLCAFSGLNDHTGFFEGKTQNWGQIPKEFRDILRAEGESPGVLCNAHLVPVRGGGDH